MALYRCAACGSSNVMLDKQVGGYSYSKGILGSLFFGTGGAAAGVNGKVQTVYKCPDCGQTLTYCMPEAIKMKVEMAVIDPNFPPDEWRFLKGRYKNIGETARDHAVKREEEKHTQLVESLPDVTESEFNSWAEDIRLYWGKLGYYGKQEQIYDIEKGKLPTANEYRDICAKVRTLINQLPRFSSRIRPLEISTSALPLHEQILEELCINDLLSFDIALDYYERTGRAIPVNKRTFGAYFYRNPHLLKIALSHTGQISPFSGSDMNSFNVDGYEYMLSMKNIWFSYWDNNDLITEDDNWSEKFTQYIFPRLIIKNEECIICTPVFEESE